MTQKRLVLLAVLFVGCSTVPASGQQGAVRLLEHFRRSSEIRPGQPYQVLRMDLDLTGDATAEMLLSRVLPDGRSGEQEWFIYTRVGEGQYRLLGILDFSYLMFRMGGEQRLILYDRGLGVLVTYRGDSTGLHEEARQTGVVAGGPEWDAFRAWRETSHLRVLSVAIGDLLANSDPTWTDLLSNEVVPGVGRLEATVVE